MTRIIMEVIVCSQLDFDAESEVELLEKIVKWKAEMEVKGLKMDTGKMKVMFNCSTTERVEEKDNWHYGVCKKVVGNNSTLCTCQKWIY